MKLDAKVKISHYFIAYMVVCSNICNAQTYKKPNLYLFFENDTTKRMFKRHFEQDNPKTTSKYIFDLFDYNYSSAQEKHYQFSTKQESKPCIVNNNYIQRVKPKNWVWLRNLKNALPSTGYKDFPYKHVYIVEKNTVNTYKVTEVETFIGEDF